MTEVANKKRILIFSTAYLPFVGGAEIAVKEITDRLPQYEFVMVTAKIKKGLPDVENVGNIEVHRIGIGSSWDKIRLVIAGPRLASTLGKFSGVWSIMASYAGFAALRYKKQNPSVRYLLTLQEGDSRFDIYKHVWWCWPYFKQIFTRANRIQAISNYLAKWARDMGAKCPIDVVPNGVCLSQYSTSSVELKKQNRKKIGIPDNVVVVGSVSRLVKKNGITNLISALKYLPQSYHLLIVGSGAEEISLKKQATKIAKDRVHFVGGVDPDSVPLYLSVMDVFCRPSLSEGLGNAFLEAYAAGVPVVGTRVGGIPDFLVDGETGLFCEAKNPKDIARAIKTILDKPVLTENIIANANILVKERYDWVYIAENMGTCFQSL